MPKIALIQLSATPDPEVNLHNGLNLLEEASVAGARMAVFPELAFLPFFPQRRRDRSAFDLAEAIPGPTVERFAERARALSMVIVLNLFERDGDSYYDASPVIDADGRLLGAARMVHIADFEGFYEKDYYTPGDRGASVFSTAVGKVGVAICYDRHFPEHMRSLALQGAEMVVIPQAGVTGEWPKGMYEGEVRVAAFQNGYFALLANRVGQEDELSFAGESFAVDPDGKVIARAPAGKDHVLLIDVNLKQVGRSVGRTLFLKDRRPDAYGET